MRPDTLKEFAQLLRVRGDFREVEFADEILELVELEEEVAEPYSELCDDLNHHAPEGLKDKPAKALEWLGDRSALLVEIEEQFQKASREGDADDIVREVLDELNNVETIMREHGGWTEGDLQDALFALIKRAGKAPQPLQYDL